MRRQQTRGEACAPEQPLDAAAHFLLASLLAQEGKSDQAIVGFQRALTLDPTNPETLYNLGTMLLSRESRQLSNLAAGNLTLLLRNRFDS